PCLLVSCLIALISIPLATEWLHGNNPVVVHGSRVTAGRTPTRPGLIRAMWLQECQRRPPKAHPRVGPPRPPACPKWHTHRNARERASSPASLSLRVICSEYTTRMQGIPQLHVHPVL